MSSPPYLDVPGMPIDVMLTDPFYITAAGSKIYDKGKPKHETLIIFMGGLLVR